MMESKSDFSPDKIRVAYVCANPSYRLDACSGYATHIRDLGAALNGSGCEISVILASDGRGGVGSVESGPRRHPLRRLFPAFAWEWGKDVSRLVSDSRFRRVLGGKLDTAGVDLVYERLDVTGGAADRWAGTRSKPYVVEIHAPLDREGEILAGRRPLARLFRKRVRRALRAADAVVTVSELLKTWVETEGVVPDRIHVVSNGVDLALFDPGRIQPGRLSPRKDGEVVVGYVGSSLRWHGLPELLEAFAGARREHRMVLTVVGLASSDAELKRRAAELGIVGDIRFVAPVAHCEIPSVVSGFDIAVMAASNDYGSPIKIFEYGAMGIPIIAPATPPVLEVMENGHDGILIPSGNIQALESALGLLAGDPAFRTSLGRAFMRKVRSRYGWGHAGAKVARVFRNVLGRRKIG